MVYVYKNEFGEVTYTRDERVVAMIPATLDETGESKVITLDKMIPEPQVDGYTSILKADFKTGRVYYELEISLDQVKMEQIKRAKDWKQKTYNLNTADGVITFWIDSKTRATILNSLLVEQNEGKKTTKIYIQEKLMEFPIGSAIEMINQMDGWDKQVYEVEAKHIENIINMTSPEEVKAYNYRTGYPANLWGSVLGLQAEYQRKQSRGSLDLLLEFTSQIINLYTLDNEDLKKFKYLYPSFESEIGKPVRAGYLLNYAQKDSQGDPQLYRVLQDHVVTRDVTPDTEGQTYYELLTME